MINSIKTEFKRIVQNATGFLRYYWVEPTRPVLIYQMGKVASSSIYSSLKCVKGTDVFHVHRLNPENIELVKNENLRRGDSPINEQKGLYLYKNVISPRKKTVKFISLVREPIGRNISAFFQNLQSFKGVRNAHKINNINELITDFIEHYNHNVPLTWFDVEMQFTTGIEVYQHSFPHQKGFCVISSHPFQLLIMRHDLDDKVKEKCISEFLNIESFHISRSNEASSKEYADTYNKFINNIKVPSDYAEPCCLQSTHSNSTH